MLDINIKFKITRINMLLSLLGKVNSMKKQTYYEVTLRKNYRDILEIKIIKLKGIHVDVWQKKQNIIKQLSSN